MDYIEAIEESLRPLANAVNANAMKAYMKGQFAFLGVKSPDRKLALKTLLSKQSLPSIDEMESLVWQLWQKPEREYQMAAMEFMNKFKRQYFESHIVLFEKILLTKSWWDTVDALSVHQVGTLAKTYPNIKEKVIRGWINHESMWLNRAAILFQLKYKSDMDYAFLEDAILPHIFSKEFFHQKAIGWVLREISRINPDYVLEFVNVHDLKPLSRREALRLMK